jgi:hypothetical protein
MEDTVRLLDPGLFTRNLLAIAVVLGSVRRKDLVFASMIKHYTYGLSLLGLILFHSGVANYLYLWSYN